MTLNSELALASRVLNSIASREPDVDPESAWQELTDELDACRTEGAKQLTIIAWRKRLQDERRWTSSSPERWERR
jgi:hypothetical protein